MLRRNERDDSRVSNLDRPSKDEAFVLGFWGTAIAVLLPLFLLLAWLVTQVIRGMTGKLLALQLPLYGILYPLLAGLDPDRETLYLNLCALMFLAYTAWLLVLKFSRPCPVDATGNLSERPSLPSLKTDPA